MAQANRTIYVKIRQIYGNVTLYPACQTAELLCELAGTKTITPSQLRTINALGYDVKETPVDAMRLSALVA